MRKKIAFVVALFLSVQITSSQDLIVTKQNDSIQCKILRVKKDIIYFVFKNKDEFQSTSIPVDDIIDYRKSFYESNQIPKESLPDYNEYAGFRFAFNGGYSYDPGRLNSNTINLGFEDFYRELRSGYHLEANITYYLSKNIGLGIKYNIFKTSNSIENVGFIDTDGSDIIGTLANDITVSFVGAVLSYRFPGKKSKNAFILNSSIGYLSYRDNQVLAIPVNVKGNNLGFSFDIGYDFLLAERLSLGIQAGATSGRIRELEITGDSGTSLVRIPDDERPSGSARLDFSIGLRYNL
ncbi:hypothetical protein [Flagellimonas meridianipacifica]|uniref:Outer membrane protein with beta-barrel domain n=1 Tax=Flagellimonas meridianipacifica TaxID=1080225 RepID=A0A2T0M6N0_9FLAO|nr:hypothetical protein [Allomuricauda pacifica]PRX53113.1 hypothetical protein CLV81_4014 [Allomuricauda pacifica]